MVYQSDEELGMEAEKKSLGFNSSQLAVSILQGKLMKIMSLLLLGAFVLTNGSLWAVSDRQDSMERLQTSTDVLHSIVALLIRGFQKRC